MSNQQIAINLWSAGCSKSDIERALDEAEKRGYQQCHEHDNRKLGFIDGQRDMRERAAKQADKNFKSVGDEIRALPIEGE